MRSQLTGSIRTIIGSGSTYTDSYTYDKAGNVQHHICNTIDTAFGFTGDLMMSGNGGSNDDFNAVWNDNGNLTKKDQATDTNLVYNWDNKLSFAEKYPRTIALKYDPMGNRISKVRTGTLAASRRYIVDVSGELPVILLEIDANDSSLKRTYVYANSEILAQHNGPAATADANFFLHDRLGSVREVMDKNGMVKKYFTYDPFGKLREGSTLSSDYPFGFTGQWYDYEFGQYYLRARQYDPLLMRLTSYDPVRGKYIEPLTLHKYLYCNNDPINRIDPDGRFAYWGVKVLSGAIGAGIAGGVAWASGQDRTAIGAAALAGFVGGYSMNMYISALVGGMSSGFSTYLEGGGFKEILGDTAIGIGFGLAGGGIGKGLTGSFSKEASGRVSSAMALFGSTGGKLWTGLVKYTYSGLRSIVDDYTDEWFKAMSGEPQPEE